MRDILNDMQNNFEGFVKSGICGLKISVVEYFKECATYLERHVEYFKGSAKYFEGFAKYFGGCAKSFEGVAKYFVECVKYLMVVQNILKM